jgi:hypothetical protein
MQDNLENTLENLINKFPGYTDKKENFRKKFPALCQGIEYMEKEVEEKKEQEFIKINRVKNCHLKRHFGLLTEEENQIIIEVDKISAKYFCISYELYIEMRERYTKYFDDVKVLLTFDYPYHIAYKIGNSIDDSDFIECSLYINDIYKIIDIFLKTGEKVHDV